MANPLMILKVISTGLAVAGGIAQSNAQNKADAKAAQHNINVLNQQAHDDKAAAALKAAERRKDTRQRVGSQTALLAAEGQSVDSGDALRLTQDVQQRGDFLADLDQAEGDRLARAKLADADFIRKSTNRRIKSRSRMSLLNAAGTFASAGAKMY